MTPAEEDRAKELLAQEYERDGYDWHAENIRSGNGNPIPLRAITRALSQPALDREEVARIINPEAYILPCDVRLPPRTTIRKGCKLSTLLAGMRVQDRPRFEDVDARAAISAMPEGVGGVPEGWRLYTVDASIEGRWRVMLKGPDRDYPAEEDWPAHRGPSYVCEVGHDLASGIAACAAAIRARGGE